MTEVEHLRREAAASNDELANRVKAASLTAHVYGETRLDQANVMSYVPRDLSHDVVLSIGDFEL
jgi:hypothetical protein